MSSVKHYKTGKIPLRITGGKIYAIMSLTTDSQDCGLCRKNLLDITQHEIDKAVRLGKLDILNDRVVIGKCKHAFHIECMDYRKKAGGDMDAMNVAISCPVCKSIFVEEKRICTNNLQSSRKISAIDKLNNI